MEEVGSGFFFSGFDEELLAFLLLRILRVELVFGEESGPIGLGGSRIVGQTEVWNRQVLGKRACYFDVAQREAFI